jgi:flagellar protein FliO/FliZ
VTAWPTAARRPLLLLALGALPCAGLAVLPGEAGPLAARAGLAALAVGAVAVAAGRRRGVGSAPALRVTARAALGRAASVAVVEVEGRRFLVGAGAGALELLAELEPAADQAPAQSGGSP